MNIKTFVMRCGLATCLLVQPVVAGPLEDGQAAYDTNDYSTALKLWQPVADLGFAPAQYNLGIMYAKGGKGLPQDYAKAAKWLRLAADQGYDLAQFNFGLIYLNGRGVPQDYAEAAKWHRLAADQGYAVAQLHLGMRYAKGEGIPQDYAQAHMWWNLAAAGSSSSETKMRDEAITYRDSIAKHMTPDQIAEAQRLAREWTAAHPKRCEGC